MDTLTFLRKILPSSGHYVLARFRDGMDAGKRPAQARFDTIEQLAAAALQFDTKGEQVFHACASFVEPRKREVRLPDGRLVQAEATRAQDNVAFIRSQWLDVDVGPKKDYPDLRSAVLAVGAMCKGLKLPLPMLVQSGRGLHCYWTFTKDLPLPAATTLARTFYNALKATGFKHDTSRTADLASILRPVGTHWRKEGEVEVCLLRDAEPISPKAFMTALGRYIEPPKPAAVAFGDEWSSGTKANYPPSSALRIVQFCGAMRHVVDAGGDVPEPLWRAMLGLVKHTVEGEDQAHEWSRGAADYDPAVTQQKLDNWTVGPAACGSFAAHCDACGQCKYAERVKSPIQLGYSEELPPAAEAPAPVAEPVAGAHPAAEPEVEEVSSWARKMPAELPFWPGNRYAWNGEQLCALLKVDDVVEWQPFCNRLFYPYLRHPGEDGDYVTKITALIDPKRGRWREFDIPAKTVAEAKACAGAMGAYELYAIGKNGKEHMRAYVQYMLETMQEQGIETTTYNAFGWHDEGFVIGTTKLTAKGQKPIFLGDRVPHKVRTDFGTSGTAEEWSKLICHIYNRPGAEPYQFLIMAAFGAPLVKLAGVKMWHGIPIALTGDTGLGKTTTCKVACSMYGDPEHLTLSADEQGTTMNALIKRVAVARNLPIILDEMTGRTPKDLQDMLFALSNGQPKERLTTVGNTVDGDLTWDTLSFVTGNMDITGLLSQLDRVKAGATQMRCFEIPLPDDFNEHIFKGVNAKELIDGELLAKQYGAAGQKYLAYVIAHRRAICDKLHKLRAKTAPTSRDETRERFYMDCIITAVLGGAIAKSLGLIDFDIEGVRRWAVSHVKRLRTRRAAASYSSEDYVQAFLSSLHGRTVVTNYFSDGRTGKDRGIELVDETRLRNPIARNAVKDRRFFVTARGFSEWCQEQQINASWLRDELDKCGYLVHHAGAKDDRQRIFRGSNITGSQVRCIEFVYDKIDGAGAKPALAPVGRSEKEEVA